MSLGAKIIFILAAIAAAAEAHRLNLHVFDENGSVSIRAYYTLAAPCRACAVSIEDLGGGKLELVTDDNGYVIFAPRANSMTIKAYGGSGHFTQADYTLETPIETGDQTFIFILKLIFSLCVLCALFLAVWKIKTSRRN